MKPADLPADVAPFASAPEVETALDQLYLVRRGFIFLSPCYPYEAAPFQASIYLTTGRKPFEISFKGHRGHYEAIAVRPMVPRRVQTRDHVVICVGVTPNHPQYRRFRAVRAPGYMALPREAYARFERDFEAAFAAKLSSTGAAQLFDDFMKRALDYLPSVKALDARVERALELLQENHNYPLLELAGALGLSYGRMSHLFADGVGLPLRSYQLWQKLHVSSSLIGSSMSLSQIARTAGFTDAAHLAHVWKKAYGAPPTYFCRRDTIEFRSVCRMSARGARRARNRKPPLLPTPQQCFCQRCIARSVARAPGRAAR